MAALTNETPRERHIADALRAIAVHEIEQRGTDQAARCLGLATTGVEALLWRQVWPVETALRVVDTLGLSVLRSLEETLDAQSPTSNGSSHARSA